MHFVNIPFYRFSLLITLDLFHLWLRILQGLVIFRECSVDNSSNIVCFILYQECWSFYVFRTLFWYPCLGTSRSNCHCQVSHSRFLCGLSSVSSCSRLRSLPWCFLWIHGHVVPCPRCLGLVHHQIIRSLSLNLLLLVSSLMAYSFVNLDFENYWPWSWLTCIDLLQLVWHQLSSCDGAAPVWCCSNSKEIGWRSCRQESCSVKSNFVSTQLKSVGVESG